MIGRAKPSRNPQRNRFLEWSTSASFLYKNASGGEGVDGRSFTSTKPNLRLAAHSNPLSASCPFFFFLLFLDCFEFQSCNPRPHERDADKCGSAHHQKQTILRRARHLANELRTESNGTPPPLSFTLLGFGFIFVVRETPERRGNRHIPVASIHPI